MRIVVLTLLALALAACSETVVSKRHPGPINDQEKVGNGGNGIVYLLPMRLAQLTVQRTPVPNDLEKKLTAARSKLVEAKAAKKKADKEKEEAADFVKDLETNNGHADAIKKAKVALSAMESAARKADKALAAAQTAVTELEAMRDLRNAMNRDEPKKSLPVTYKLELALLPTQGDPRQVFVANLEHSELRDDNITFGTTAEGLLTTTTVKAADRTGDILVSLAGTLGALGLVPPVPGPAGTVPFADKAVPVEGKPLALPACATQPRLQLRFIFDPADDADVLRINREMLECLVPYRIQVRRFEFADDNGVQPYPSEVGYPNFDWGNDETKLKGLVYRRPLPYTIQVERYYSLESQKEGTETESSNSSIDREPNAAELTAACSFKLPPVKKESRSLSKPKSTEKKPKHERAARKLVVLEKLPDECKDVMSPWAPEKWASPKAYTQALYSKLAANFEVEDGKLAILPNQGPLGLVPFEASSFVTTDYKVVFSEGMLVKWTADRPSMVAAIFRLPVAMLKALISVPGELIKLRLDITSDTRDEAQAKIQLLCAQQTLDAIEDEKKLKELSVLCQDNEE